jgi:hypothetical protein
LSIIFLVLGAYYNPSLQNLFSQTPKPRTILGIEQKFDLPSKILPTPSQSAQGGQVLGYYGDAFCNMTSTTFVTGDPAQVSVEIQVPSAIICRIYTVEVDPENAMMYMPPLMGENIPPWLSQIFLYPTDNRTWVGGQWVVFETSGMVSLKIKIYYEYPIGSSITDTYTTSVAVPNISISTGAEAQQQSNANLNLSLTFVVLFFAAFDIAVVLYEHSEDKDKTSGSGSHPFIVTG